MKKIKNRIIINLFIIVIFAFIIRIYIDNNVFEVTNINYEDQELPKSFNDVKILHISDLHNKLYGKNQVTLLKTIEEISPDYIFLTGDMVSSKDTDFSNFYRFAQSIGKMYECYYIIGNHEMDLSNELRKSICDELETYNITVLDNKKVVIDQGEDSVNLYGMWYNPKYYKIEDFKLDNMYKLLGKSEDGFNILLTHNPDDFEIYADWGADLTLSGHVHGGMIRLPFIGGIISPNRTLFPKYDSGLYEYKDSNLVVSRGLSRGATGIRIFNQPELVIVTLKSVE